MNTTPDMTKAFHIRPYGTFTEIKRERNFIHQIKAQIFVASSFSIRALI